jgi:hypothetical protein
MSKTGSPSQDNIQREKGKNRILILNWKYITEFTFNERTVEFGLHWSNITSRRWLNSTVPRSGMWNIPEYDM